jgi:hypothetical protein
MIITILLLPLGHISFTVVTELSPGTTTLAERASPTTPQEGSRHQAAPPWSAQTESNGIHRRQTGKAPHRKDPAPPSSTQGAHPPCAREGEARRTSPDRSWPGSGRVHHSHPANGRPELARPSATAGNHLPRLEVRRGRPPPSRPERRGAAPRAASRGRSRQELPPPAAQAPRRPATDAAAAAGEGHKEPAGADLAAPPP